MAVLNAENGEELATLVLPASVEKAPLLVNDLDKMFFGCMDGKLYCASVKPGNIIWKFTSENAIKCTPCFCRRDTAIAFGSYDKHVYCVETESGKLVWKTFAWEVVTSSPVSSGERVFISNVGGACLCLDENDGRILWKFSAASPIFGSPCMHLDCVVWPDVGGNVYGLNVDNGEKQAHFKASGPIHSSITECENHLIFGCHDHRVYCIEAAKSEFTLKNRVLLDSPVFATPRAINHNSKKFIAAATTSGNVYLMEFKSGDVCCKLTLPGQVFSSPLFLNNKIYLGCRDDRLHCLKIKDEE